MEQTTLIIRHTSGSKKGQTERFPVKDRFEVRIGRGPSNDVTFDPVKEDTISREHCLIAQDEVNKDVYTVIDLQSKNGTYVNDRLITEKTQVMAGDVIRLGKEGPAMEFDLDPRPSSHVKKTRVLETPVKETKVHDTSATAARTAEMKTPVKEGVGKNTMQHMIRESEKKNRTSLVITILAIVLLLGTGGWVAYSKLGKDKPVPPAPVTKSGMSVSEISKANQDKVVFIETGWKLVLTQSGEELYHVYLPQKVGRSINYYAAYMRSSSGRIEPYLTTKANAPYGPEIKPIGGFGTGSGFVVSNDGFIMTNRHVAATWLTAYHFADDAFPGILVEADAKGNPVITSQVGQADVGEWVPAEAMNINKMNVQNGVKVVDGVNAYLDVTFANNDLRTPAKIVRISNTHDVTMIKIDLPEKLAKVDMFDNYKEINPGDIITVMGYPSVSPDQFVASRSQDNFNRNPNVIKVPVPTVSTGNVGRLIKGSQKSSKVDEYLSTMGDYYQLTVNSTGAGNSGGPMFDDQGRVTGIYSAGGSAGGATVSYAIPIKYAIELMGRTEVIQ